MNSIEVYNDKGKVLTIDEKFQVVIGNAREKKMIVMALMEHYELVKTLKLFRKLKGDLELGMTDTGGSRWFIPYVIDGEVGSTHPDFNITMDAYIRFDKVELNFILEDMRVGKCNSVCTFDINYDKLCSIIDIIENRLNHE